MKKILLSLLLVCSSIFVSLPNEVPIVEVQAVTIRLNKKSVTLNKGKTTLKVTGTKKKVKWSSSNKKIATVTSKGKVTAKKAGTTYITARVNGKTLKCKVVVKQNQVTTNVYITRSGKKYHRIPKCGNSKYVSKVSLKYAKSHGYTPCKKCY